MKVDHFLITRFNIPLAGHTTDKKNRPALSEEWLDKRFDLFERYCLPSIAQQTSSDFKWLCLFYADTPGKYKSRINGYKEKFGNIEVCYLDDAQSADLNQSLKEIVRSNLTEGSEAVLTTRIDNDDSMHRDMMRLLRRYAEGLGASDRILSLPCGYQYDVKMNLLFKMTYVPNHYLSRVEPVGKFETVMEFMHTMAADYAPLDEIGSRSKAYWLEIVHDSNIINDTPISSRARVQLGTVSLRDFGLDVDIPWYTAWRGFLYEFIPRYIRKKLGKTRNDQTD